ncbi:hypothetical protein K503DRAFT_869785 [Rhizopogon vinicolor AM-OR11-026]|uniref:Protein kinase domain-containing protein n=1 Tax=Rhizopogon vinicolor AM-OR11-026 TaxID=1314800 RepID=A0A1B7MKG4_9AGAM|nr:hypothetical protein K503DRAFT_869785 [Rhizopogon vinicolor AM-OR11-026]
MNTPQTGSESPTPRVSRLNQSLSSLASSSRARSTLIATQLLPSANITQFFSALSPERMCSRGMQSSLENSTFTRPRTDSFPPIRPHLLAHDEDHSNTRRFVFLSHQGDRELSPAPTSVLASSVSGPLNQFSHSRYYLLNEDLNLPGDVTPPNGVPRRWWSRGSVSPGINTFRDLVVSGQGQDDSPLFPTNDYVERENSDPSSSHKVSILPLSFSDLPSLSREDLPICHLDAKNIHNKHEEEELSGSLLLSSPQRPPATVVSPTTPTAHRQTLKSLGIGIEEDLRNEEIEHSFWPRLLGRSPTGRSPSKPRIAELVTSASPSENVLQVEENQVVSMENWDGKSLHVTPLSIVVVSASSLSPEEGEFTASSSRVVFPTPTGKDNGEVKAEDTFLDEPSVPTPRAHSKHAETWYDRFTFPALRRESAKGRGKEGNTKERWLRARENVSLALNAVLPSSELAQLSEAGERFSKEGEVARSKANSCESEKVLEDENTQGAERDIWTGKELWMTVKSTVTTVSPMLRTSLTILGDVSKLTPIPGLNEAARMLLAIWEAVDTVESNRSQCLRLIERCATAIFSVRAELADAERDMKSQPCVHGDAGLADEMRGPVGKLNECIGMVYDFLLKLNRRPFIKRFLRSDEIQHEIQACDKALGDAMQMFSISIQIRLLKEFKRFARESQRFLEAEYRAQMQGWLTPPPLYSSPLMQTLPTSPEHTPRVGVQALQEPQDILPAVSGLSRKPHAQKSSSSAPQYMLSQPNNAVSTSNVASASPLTELQRLLSVENALDMEHDRALFHATLQSGICARSDVEMLRVLEVSPEEAPEALKALRRAEAMSREMEASTGQGWAVIGGLEREFMESGIEALTRLSSVAVQKAGDRDGDVPWDLPPWTITRYEADRLIMIGCGSFSKVYLGSWSGRRVAIKVLSSYTSASLFRQEVEIWRKLRHDNVLRMWGASSAQGERPWFIVSEYCGGGSLVGWLRERKCRVGESSTGGALSPPSASTKGEVDLLRCMHHISRGMVYLHDENVLHGDLKASNVLVDDNGRCVISDFGQSEMKWEVSRRSGKSITNGTLRWQAPELLNGATKLTPAADVYAFSICCIEILGMGDLPYGHREDKLVALLVLDQDKRAEIPFTRFTSLAEPLIQKCWARNPRQRPAFAMVAARLKQLRKRQGGMESPVPVRPELLIQSPQLPGTSSPGSQGVQVETGNEESSGANGAGEPVSDDSEPTSATSCWAESKPLKRPCYNPSHHPEATVNPETGIMDIPAAMHSGTVIYTPSALSRMGDSDTTSTMSSHFTLEGVQHFHHTHHVGSGYELPLPVEEHLAERRNECRFRSLVQSRHRFHHSLTLPLWSPSHVELGAVGYHSRPKGQFITLFNAMQPHKTSGSKITTIPSLGGYGSIRTGKKFDSKLTVTQRGIDLISGLLTFGLANDGTYSEHISRRHSFPLRAGHKAAYICVESTMYRFIEDLTAPKEWFKANVNAIVKEYAPRHPIQKEDVVVVVGTLCAPEYALLVSHSHPNGQAHFNVFSDRKTGGQWGAFTTDTEYPSDEGGPLYIEEIPPKAMLTSKVSPVRMNPGSDDNDWDTLMLARLRFPTDATEPTSQ